MKHLKTFGRRNLSLPVNQIELDYSQILGLKEMTNDIQKKNYRLGNRFHRQRMSYDQAMPAATPEF